MIETSNSSLNELSERLLQHFPFFSTTEGAKEIKRLKEKEAFRMKEDQEKLPIKKTVATYGIEGTPKVSNVCFKQGCKAPWLVFFKKGGKVLFSKYYSTYSEAVRVATWVRQEIQHGKISAP